MSRLSILLVSILWAGCVEQTSDAPSEEDVKAARENILKTAPTPKFPVNAVLVNPGGEGQGKVIYLGTDVDTPITATCWSTAPPSWPRPAAGRRRSATALRGSRS